MNDDINYLIYYRSSMESFKNLFGFKKKSEDPMIPKYIKEDGTKVIETYSELGKVVYEINPRGLLIMRSYLGEYKLLADYARKANLEIGHRYDNYNQIVYEFNSLYDEHNKLAKKIEINYEYYDNGIKSKETTYITPAEVKTEINYDTNGKQTDKIEQRGSVKTYFDKDNKPYKREIDKGSGGVISEDL